MLTEGIDARFSYILDEGNILRNMGFFSWDGTQHPMPALCCEPRRISDCAGARERRDSPSFVLFLYYDYYYDYYYFFCLFPFF